MANTLDNRRWTSVLPVGFALWTLFVWGGRLRNLLQEPGPLADVSRWSVAGAVTFSAVGLAVLVFALSGGRGILLRAAVFALVALTFVVWAVRAVDIAAGDHSLGFIIVHLVLAVVSVVLGGLALWAVTIRRQSAVNSSAASSEPESQEQSVAPIR